MSDAKASDPVSKQSVSSDAASPELAGLADGCVRMVMSKLGIELDYTPDTLPLLDHYLNLAHDRMHEEAGSSDEKLDALVQLLSVPAGAYFAEVVRRHHPARVVLTTDEVSGASEHARVQFSHVFLHFDAIAMAREAVIGEEEGRGAHFEVLAKDQDKLEPAIAELGEIEEDAFFALTTRYEMLLEVLAVLERNRASESEYFGEEVYRAALGESAKKRLLAPGTLH